LLIKKAFSFQPSALSKTQEDQSAVAAVRRMLIRRLTDWPLIAFAIVIPQSKNLSWAVRTIVNPTEQRRRGHGNYQSKRPEI